MGITYRNNTVIALETNVVYDLLVINLNWHNRKIHTLHHIFGRDSVLERVCRADMLIYLCSQVATQDLEILSLQPEGQLNVEKNYISTYV